jgi:two-component system sensor histidine kinase KdpD
VRGTGARSKAPTVPDPVVRAADEIELVDVTPEALRDRIARDQVYPREHAEAALSGAFRVGPLAALRELALLWLAASLTQNRQRYRPTAMLMTAGRPGNGSWSRSPAARKARP